MPQLTLSRLLSSFAPDNLAYNSDKKSQPVIVPPTTGAHNPEIKGVSLHSGMVAPGHLFAALPGVKSDGREFIDAAIKAGAVAILAQTGTQIDNADGVTLITHDEPRLLFAHICAAFFAKQPRTIAAITGTNGKTSTAQFARELWALAGYRAASLGTLGLVAPHITQSGALTTPDTVSLHRDLAMLAENSVTHLAMEAGSHGLAQHRLDGVKVSLAGFTNLSRDHLDYHETMENYLAAKARLFDELLVPGGTAVLNADVPEYETLKTRAENAGRKTLSYGMTGGDLHITNRDLLPDGQVLTVRALGEDYKITLPLLGAFQAMNAMCAAGLLIAGGEAVETTLNNLARLTPVRGRMELVGTTKDGAAVYVDYAHTPDGLETVLKALRPHTSGQLVAVFGCGGDRDPGKRPMMGKIAADLADIAIVTDDNPRTENPEQIRAAIMAACPGGVEIGDRAKAIADAVARLKQGDVLVIAGKGHEQGQIIGTETRPFDDASIARFALAQNAA